QRRSNGYVGGHSTAVEGRELRRFDHVREDRGRRGNRKPYGGLTVSGEAAAKQSQKPFKQRRLKGQQPLPEGNPAAFRTWYVPDGVDTGPSGHRNADSRGPKKKSYGKKPGGQGRPGAGGNRMPGNEGGRQGRGRGGGGGAAGEQRSPGQNPNRPARPYGHPGNAPVFPSDHANPGSNPYGRPHGPRPGGNRPNGPRGPRPNGPRPGGSRGPGGHRGGNR